VGDMLFRFSSFPVLKLLVALCLSSFEFPINSFFDHIVEYSKWEAAKELSDLSLGIGKYALVVFIFFLAFMRLLRVSVHFRDTVDDIVVLSFFNMVLVQSNDILQFIFAGNLLISYLFTLTLLSMASARPSAFFRKK